VIFVDTSVWFARFVPRDINHTHVTSWFTANQEPLVTSDYCVDEVLSLISVRERPSLAVQAGFELLNETVAQLHFLDVNQFSRAWILFQQRATSGWSFTDCTSKILIDDLNLSSAATLDQHFHQFGIAIVPGPE
jgi:predicted nucleic acid-binding protein